MEIALPQTAPTRPPNETKQLHAAAEQLEAQFIAEMLKAVDIGQARDSFGGGIGEEQFASMLRDQLASALSGNGGFGLTEPLFQAMVQQYGPDK